MLPGQSLTTTGAWNAAQGQGWGGRHARSSSAAAVPVAASSVASAADPPSTSLGGTAAADLPPSKRLVSSGGGGGAKQRSSGGGSKGGAINALRALLGSGVPLQPTLSQAVQAALALAEAEERERDGAGEQEQEEELPGVVSYCKMRPQARAPGEQGQLLQKEYADAQYVTRMAAAQPQQHAPGRPIAAAYYMAVDAMRAEGPLGGASYRKLDDKAQSAAGGKVAGGMGPPEEAPGVAGLPNKGIGSILSFLRERDEEQLYKQEQQQLWGQNLIHHQPPPPPFAPTGAAAAPLMPLPTAAYSRAQIVSALRNSGGGVSGGASSGGGASGSASSGGGWGGSCLGSSCPGNFRMPSDAGAAAAEQVQPARVDSMMPDQHMEQLWVAPAVATSHLSLREIRIASDQQPHDLAVCDAPELLQACDSASDLVPDLPVECNGAPMQQMAIEVRSSSMVESHSMPYELSHEVDESQISPVSLQSTPTCDAQQCAPTCDAELGGACLVGAPEAAVACAFGAPEAAVSCSSDLMMAGSASCSSVEPGMMEDESSLGEQQYEQCTEVKLQSNPEFDCGQTACQSSPVFDRADRRVSQLLPGLSSGPGQLLLDIESGVEVQGQAADEEQQVGGCDNNGMAGSAGQDIAMGLPMVPGETDCDQGAWDEEDVAAIQCNEEAQGQGDEEVQRGGCVEGCGGEEGEQGQEGEGGRGQMQMQVQGQGQVPTQGKEQVQESEQEEERALEGDVMREVGMEEEEERWEGCEGHEDDAVLCEVVVLGEPMGQVCLQQPAGSPFGAVVVDEVLEADADRRQDSHSVSGAAGHEEELPEEASRQQQRCGGVACEDVAQEEQRRKVAHWEGDEDALLCEMVILDRDKQPRHSQEWGNGLLSPAADAAGSSPIVIGAAEAAGSGASSPSSRGRQPEGLAFMRLARRGRSCSSSPTRRPEVSAMVGDAPGAGGARSGVGRSTPGVGGLIDDPQTHDVLLFAPGEALGVRESLYSKQREDQEGQLEQEQQEQRDEHVAAEGRKVDEAGEVEERGEGKGQVAGELETLLFDMQLPAQARAERLAEALRRSYGNSGDGLEG